MLSLSPEQQREFSQAVRAVANQVPLQREVRNLYVALQDAIDLRQPVCRTSGRCCRFEEFDHRLYVTTAELGTFLAELNQAGKPNPGGCPFQVTGLCSVHAIRPLGCRIFFCDETAKAWQEEQYGRFHRELQQIHDRWGTPYFYLEWRQALAWAGVGAAKEL